ncbi:aspartate kinase [Alphaproteobacteria bacterium]|nr:aspartate kinase [Alphaproteobacteria bacterium]MDC0969608.1 aspartate kinase [Alphaproteobacteria bacterium]
MNIVVLKFGGTSVADVPQIKKISYKIKSEVDEGNKVIVVVSAMSGVTNNLIELVNNTSELAPYSEYDVVLSSGEQVTAALLTIALNNLNIKGRSWLGWQVPIITENTYGKAVIEEIKTLNILESFKNNEVAIISGFQGISSENRITTLGRGGSDTSAVAIAAAFSAERCDIYTDVDGVYTTDPRIVKSAKKLESITYEEMLELASQGAKVLQTRSVALGMKYGVNLRVLSSFEDLPGTHILKEGSYMEKSEISGIAHSLNEAKVTLSGVPDKPGQAAQIFSALADYSINVDMIVQSSSINEGSTDITFTIPETDLKLAERTIKKTQEKIGFKKFISETNVVKISVVGNAMRTQSGVAKTMFETLAKNQINIHVISTSEIKISVLISSDYYELAMRSLHSAFGLDA